MLKSSYCSSYAIAALDYISRARVVEDLEIEALFFLVNIFDSSGLVGFFPTDHLMYSGLKNAFVKKYLLLAVRAIRSLKHDKMQYEYLLASRPCYVQKLFKAARSIAYIEELYSF